MLLRTLLMMLTSRRRSKLTFRDVGRVTMRVLPTDIDLLGHINNGIYLSLMDLGRMDLMIRTGHWAQLGKLGWYPVASNVTISYRRSLRTWEKYTLETRMIGFDDKGMFCEQRFVRGNELYVTGIMRARFLKKSGGTVTVAELGELGGVDPTTMRVPEWMSRWAKDVAMPPAKASVPSDWD